MGKQNKQYGMEPVTGSIYAYKVKVKGAKNTKIQKNHKIKPKKIAKIQNTKYRKQKMELSLLLVHSMRFI